MDLVGPQYLLEGAHAIDAVSRERLGKIEVGDVLGHDPDVGIGVAHDAGSIAHHADIDGNFHQSQDSGKNNADQGDD